MNYDLSSWSNLGSKRRRLGDPESWAHLVPMTEEEARVRLRAAPGCHYTYVLIDHHGVPLYVGKGRQWRAFDHVAEHSGRAPRIRSHKFNAIGVSLKAGHEIRYALPGIFPNHDEAIAMEMDLIARIGRYYTEGKAHRGPLTNQTAGGEGTVDPSPEARLARSLSLWGPSPDPERFAAWRFVSEISPKLRSNILKPMDGHTSFASELRSTRPPETRSGSSSSPGATRRRATTVVALAIASGSLLNHETEIPRLLHIETGATDPVRLVVENGALQDVVNALMVEVKRRESANPETEVIAFRFNARALARRVFGDDQLVSLGVLLPNE
ncbi:hypothetical protein [Roseomonas sp. BN140053]|uniref:hypothetical protein n=1 Tax=Roseomonas sp. BN140053 TaxID=3391898 RepID=UPI0039E8FDD0